MNKLYHVAVYFKQSETEKREALGASWNEHLRQSHPRLKLAGMLMDKRQVPVGVMSVVEAESLEEAQRFLDSSPYQEAGLYEAARVEEVSLEVGKIQ